MEHDSGILPYLYSMTDLQNYVAIVSKGKQDFSKKDTAEGNYVVTVVTNGNQDTHAHFDKDGNYTHSSAS